MFSRKTVTAAVVAAIVGAVVAGAAQLYVPSREGVRWWLDSQVGVDITLRALRVTGVFVGLALPWPPWRRGHWLPAFALWAGVNIALTFVLFSIGPGNLFPIVVGLGAMYTLWAIAYGVLIGVAIRGLAEMTWRFVSPRSSSQRRA